MNTENILQEVTKLLEEEKWSKFQLSEYNLTKFTNIDNLVNQIRENELTGKVMELANDYLKKNEFNLIAKYLMAIFSFPDNKIDFNSGFKKIISTFKEREKWGIVEFLAQKMLEYEESEFALRSLIESLKLLNKTKDVLTLQKKLLKLIPEDFNLALNLARSYENLGSNEDAVKFYRMSLKLFIKNKNSKLVEDIWAKLSDIAPDPLEIYNEVENLLSSNFPAEFNIKFLSQLINHLTKNKKYDAVINIIKKILAIQKENREYREELIKVYRLKYEKHSKLEELLKSSGLRMWWKDVNSSIELFEKQIKFDENVYVFHYSWGTGKIVKIEKDFVFIDFENSPDHKMSFDMALNTLMILPDDHIKVRIRYDSENIKKLTLDEPIKIIEQIISQMPNKEMTTDQLKDELTPKILQSTEWQRWWNKVKKELKMNQNFNLSENEKTITYIESNTSYGDIILNKFNTTENFLSKIDVINELIENDVNKKVSLEIYQQIIDYLLNFINENINTHTDLVYIANIIINKVKSFNNAVSVEGLHYDEKYILNHVDDVVSLFKQLNIIDYQKYLVTNIVNDIKDWDKILYNIMFTEIPKIFDFIIEIFIKNNKTDRIKQLGTDILEKYRDTPELFYFLAKNILSNTWANIIKADNELKNKLYQTSFFLLSFCGRQIKNNVKTDFFLKIQKQIIRLLFDKKTDNFLNFIKAATESEFDTSSLLTLFKENEYIPKKQKENMTAELRNIERIGSILI